VKHVLVLLLLILSAGAQGATTTYAATTLGPYKSTDGGATWQSMKVSVTNALLQGVANVPAIAVDPLNPAIIYFVGGVSVTVTVTTAVVTAPILSAGPQAVASGVDQFNILIPPELAAGGQLTAAGQTANAVSLTVK
jgi:hypothetical protein